MAQEKPLAVVPVEIWFIIRSPPVKVIEVEPRGSVIGKRVRIVLFLKAAGGIESKVVVDELAEVSITG